MLSDDPLVAALTQTKELALQCIRIHYFIFCGTLLYFDVPALGALGNVVMIVEIYIYTFLVVLFDALESYSIRIVLVSRSLLQKCITGNVLGSK